MAHYKLMFPSKYIDAATLEGHDVVVEIESVRMETLEGEKGEKDTKPVVRLKGKKKLWVLNKTNAKIIARLYSNDVDGWIGKRITLYPTTCDAFGQHDIECVRVRKAAPKPMGPASAAPQPSSSPAQLDPDQQAKIGRAH